MAAMGKKILYFDKPGPQNTDSVVQVVKERIKELNVKHVVVASESGRTALKVAEALRDLKVKIVCVTAYAGIRKIYEKVPSQYLTNELREKLQNLGVKILDETPWIFYGSAFDRAFLGNHTPSTIIHRFLGRSLGYGFKTAIEVSLIAANVGVVPTNEEIISIAGTGWLGGGADCAIVVKPAVIPRGEFIGPENGMEVKEIIAMPRLKFTQEMIKEVKEKGYELADL